MILRLLVCCLAVSSSGLLAAEGKGVLPPNARLAILGDSITEQKLYSKFIETYLLACAGRTDVRCFQFGWSGEMAMGFVGRMESDLSVFEPTVATICYGMNDGMYRAYDDTIGRDYEKHMRTVLEKLDGLGVKKIVVGSPGAVGAKFAYTPAPVYNGTLGRLRDINRKLAADKKQVFADVHDTMLKAMEQARKALGDDYQVAGHDGIHPGSNGHLLMALAFLKALGMDGNIGTIEVDMQGGAKTSDGHKVISATGGKVELESTRWPFCFASESADPTGPRSILPFCRFNEDLNRLTLKVANLSSAKATVQWGTASKEFTRDQLQKGINLAAEFEETPFNEAFMGLMEAVGFKQSFETHAVWNMMYPFRVGPDSKSKNAYSEMKKAVMYEQTLLGDESRQKLTPVRHSVTITAGS